jgi:hypothetical protein
MSYRAPTFEELFPLSYRKQLLDIQSTHFVNNSLAKGGVSEGLEGLPTSIPDIERLSKEMTKGKIAESLVRTYVKNNWKVMLTCAIVGGTLIYVLIKIDEENRKNRTKK